MTNRFIDRSAVVHSWPFQDYDRMATLTQKLKRMGLQASNTYIGAGAIYSGGARAPPLLRVGEAKGGTELEQLQMPSGKSLPLFE